MLPRDTPDEETSDWRAVCGRTARTVRRAGRETFPTPIVERQGDDVEGRGDDVEAPGDDVEGQVMTLRVRL
jgi:hypothetical protein